MATRFYPTIKVPGVRVEGPLRNPTWADITVFSQSWADTHWTWQLSTSKTDGGTLSTDQVNTNQQGDHDLFFARWMTKPLEAQTVSGTMQICFQVSQQWNEGLLDPPTDSSDVRYRLYAYIAQGQTNAVRHVLCDVTDSTDFAYLNLTAKSLASAAALTSGNAEAGDCIVIELGFRIVSSPTPTPTYPPTEYTEIGFRGKGVDGTDMVAGDTSLDRTPWIEFSGTITEQADVAPPDNDACADSIVIASAPYTSDFIDTTQSAGTQREVWFEYVAERSGLLIAHMLGSNYQCEVDVLTGACGATSSVTQVKTNVTGAHRCQSTTSFTAVLGTTYRFRVRNRTTSQNAVNSGGSLRFSILYRETPLEDDLYLPAGNLAAFREGVMVNVSGGHVSNNPTGIAIDYTGTTIDDFNGGTHSAVRILLASHDFDLIDLIDLITLNRGQGSVDFISLPWVDDGPERPATLYVSATGTLYIGWFGNGYLYVAGVGTSTPAILNEESDDPSQSLIRYISASAGDSQASQPDDTEIQVGVDNIAPWSIAIDEDEGIIYYADGGFYTPVGGQVIKRWELGVGQMADFATLVAPSGCINPGIKGMQFIPGGGLLVCNGSEVVRLDADGDVVQTYTPTLPVLASRCVVDVKMTADGESIWVVDMNTRLTKFNIETAAIEASVQPYLTASSLTQMAIYQPSGAEPPPEPEPEPEPEEEGEEPECPDNLLDDSSPQTALARLMRVHASSTRAIEDLVDPAEEGYLGVLGDGSFGEFMLGRIAVAAADSDDCLTFETPSAPAVGRTLRVTR